MYGILFHVSIAIGGKKNQNQAWSLSLWGRSAKKVLKRDFYKAFLRATSSQEVRMFQINQFFCQIQKLSISNDHLVWQVWPRREVSLGEKLTSMSCVCVFVCLYLCFCTCVCLFVLVYLYLAILMTAGSFSWWQMSIHAPWFSPLFSLHVQRSRKFDWQIKIHIQYNWAPFSFHSFQN